MLTCNTCGWTVQWPHLLKPEVPRQEARGTKLARTANRTGGKRDLYEPNRTMRLTEPEPQTHHGTGVPT